MLKEVKDSFILVDLFLCGDKWPCPFITPFFMLGWGCMDDVDGVHLISKFGESNLSTDS